MNYAVMGNPINHSLSPLLHACFAAQCGIQMDYGRILVEGPFKDCADRFFAGGGRGANITLPCKLEAFAYADHLSENAERAGAVNTLKKEEDGTITGFNTDGPGFIRHLKFLDFPLSGASILLIGAGGAAKGILGPMLAENPDRVVIVNRTESRALELAARGSADKVSGCSFAALKDNPQHFDLIINASASSIKSILPEVSDECLAGASAVYDLMYSPKGNTIFTDHCAALGVGLCSDGFGMLVGQAVLSFKIWNGIEPDFARSLQELRQQLSAR